MNKEKSDISKKLKRPPLWVIITAAAVLVAAIVSVVIFFIWKADKASREYSGEEVRAAQMLCFDVSELGNFKVISTANTEDGKYSEHLTADDGAVDIHIRKDFTRPNMSCKKQAKELYPKLTDYKNGKLDNDEDIEECAYFTLKTDGVKYRHKIFLLRRGGWDYLVDFAVNEPLFEQREEYIDRLAESLHYL